MALDRITFPTTPNPVSGDWALLVNLVSKSFKNVNSPLQVVGSIIPEGATFQVGDVIYYGTSDTAITGTASKYVKLTASVDGLTLSAAFVANLSGVSWNKIYNGYYDISGNLYIFDEAQAIYDGTLSVSYTRLIADPVFNTLKAKTGTFSGALSSATLNTGQGANKLYAMNQNVRTTDSVIHNNLTVNGYLQPKNDPTCGFLTISSSAYILSRGVWVVNYDEPMDYMQAISAQMYTLGSWRNITQRRYIDSGSAYLSSSGGLLFSDGANVRLITNTGTYQVYYQKY